MPGVGRDARPTAQRRCVIFDAMDDPKVEWDPSFVDPEGTAQQVEPPRFEAAVPHPSSPAGSIWMTGAIARRIGGDRLRFLFRLALLAGLIAVGLAAFR